MLTKEQIQALVDKRVVFEMLGDGYRSHPAVLIKMEKWNTDLPNSDDFMRCPVTCPNSLPPGQLCPSAPPGRNLYSGDRFVIADRMSGSLEAKRDLVASMIADIVEEALELERSGGPYR